MHPFSSPLRNLIVGVGYMLMVVMLATASYVAVGWSVGDALYWVIMTIYTVGYGEVHPIDTPLLRTITIATMILGCTGMIFLTGALVQFITVSQLQQFGPRRMQATIDKLTGHVIVCGFGRIGQMLAQSLTEGNARFVILERSENRVALAKSLGYLFIQDDATDEQVLRRAGIERARALATVLPDDSANVFITLSARSLNPKVDIIARGEAPTTEKKLRHAGANRVVLPAHIGAERIAEMILYPDSGAPGKSAASAQDFDGALRSLGLGMEMIVASAEGPLAGLTVADIERRFAGAVMVVQLKQSDGRTILGPEREIRVEAGDGVFVLGRTADLGALAGS
jgi:voltage-gated potassium channel Kch